MSEANIPVVSGNLAVVVSARTDEADGIASFELQAADGSALPPFDAGAHIDVHLPGPMIRQYSLCNPPGEQHRYLIAVLREPDGRGGSARMHDVKAGDRLTISAPRNAFALDAGREPKLLVAGGIGITPLKAMAHALAARGIDFELHYFARSASRAAFRSALAAEPFAPDVHFHFDDAGTGLPLPDATLAPDRFAHVYLCGPSGFIDKVRDQAVARGFAIERIHVEHFSAESAVSGGRSFVVEAVRSGVTVTVGENESIAQALERAGVPVLTSCEQGLCGACLTPVLEGIPEHRDEYQTDAEKAGNAKMTICCSRARTPALRLDI
ncbi:PDR/VanB family oxidoreductase [Burkholderia multivorans]|nr:PDR/VanB family oxidoreductase [Burkholderia multivorans]